jgi:hypothetical protein
MNNYINLTILIIILLSIYIIYQYNYNNASLIEKFGSNIPISDNDLSGVLYSIVIGKINYDFDEPIYTNDKKNWEINGHGIYLFPNKVHTNKVRLYALRDPNETNIDLNNNKYFNGYMCSRFDVILKKNDEYYIERHGKRESNNYWYNANVYKDSTLNATNGWHVHKNKNDNGSYSELIMDNPKDVYGIVIAGRAINYNQYLKQFIIGYFDNNTQYLIDKLKLVKNNEIKQTSGDRHANHNYPVINYDLKFKHIPNSLQSNNE